MYINELERGLGDMFNEHEVLRILQNYACDIVLKGYRQLTMEECNVILDIYLRKKGMVDFSSSEFIKRLKGE